MRDGVRAGVPVALASLLVGISFGVIARPQLGAVGAVVASAIVFAGSAQFAAVAVLAAGGGVAAAVAAGVLLNLRFVPMGVALAPSLSLGAARRAATGWLMVDASWAMSSRGGGRFDVPYMLGVSAANYVAWVGGTALGVLAGSRLGSPESLGLDALFPAFFLALLMEEARGRVRPAVAVAGALIALVLTPIAPPGVPIVAAALVALVGLRRP